VTTKESAKTTNNVVINTCTDDASWPVVFSFYEAICGVGIAWDVPLLQVQPIPQTTTGTESTKSDRAGIGTPQPQNCK
jgi:hypothetical protein